MRIALAQINPTVGDIAGNGRLIEQYVHQARHAGADLVVFPELALSGYPPRDLLYQEGFLEAAAAEASRLGAVCSTGITLVFGVPLAQIVESPHSHDTLHQQAPSVSEQAREAELAADSLTVGARESSWLRLPGQLLLAVAGITNSLVAYQDAACVATYHKRLLPTYDVFDEDRYFSAGHVAVVIDVPVASAPPGTTVKVGLSICEDLWKGEDAGFAQRYLSEPDPVPELIALGAQIIVNPSASPFVVGKGRKHRDILRKHATTHHVYIAAVNQVGGNDELVFDGHAAVFDPRGQLIAAGHGFQEELVLADVLCGSRALRTARPVSLGDPLTEKSDVELLYAALVLGVRDYLRKTGFRSALLGLSGGIDSAVTAVIAAAAVGPSCVLGVSMPSEYSSQGSITDAAELAKNIGLELQTIPIECSFRTLSDSLAPSFVGRTPDVTEENLQSRIRGTILMALSNKLGHIVLTTGNKSELAVGYCTLYGDMNGGLAVLSDVTKEWVYKLAHWMNQHPEKLGIPGLSTPPIPEASITKPPSAELRPNQTDQDSLPPYPVLDEIIHRYVERRESPSRIVNETGFDSAVVARCVRLIDLSEYKRKQAAIGLKVTSVAFGSGRRMPVAQRWKPS